jgi:hypothetical protein
MFIPAYEAMNRALADRLAALENVVPLKAAPRAVQAGRG